MAYDAIIVPGAAWSDTLTVTSAGSAFNLTGYTPVAELVIGETATEVTAATLVAASGTVTLSLTAAQTLLLPEQCVGSLRCKLTHATNPTRHVDHWTVRTDEVTADAA